MQLFLVGFVAILGVSSAMRIPEYIHICKRSDPKVAKCIRDSVEVLRPKLKHGIPELGVPGLEPLHLDEIVVYNGEHGVRAILKNVNVTRASEFQITKLKVDVQNLTYHIGLRLPILTLHGVFDIDAIILTAPIKGSGLFQANSTDIEARGILKGELRQVKESRHLFFTSLDISFKMKDYSISVDQVFGGDDEILSRAAKSILNLDENKNEFIGAATPFIQRKVSEILLNMGNQITNNLDYDEMFPEN